MTSSESASPANVTPQRVPTAPDVALMSIIDLLAEVCVARLAAANDNAPPNSGAAPESSKI